MRFACADIKQVGITSLRTAHLWPNPHTATKGRLLVNL